MPGSNEFVFVADIPADMQGPREQELCLLLDLFPSLHADLS